jgi:hypothetical protein
LQQFGCWRVDDVRAATVASWIGYRFRESIKKINRDYRVGVNEGQHIAPGDACSGVSNP